MRVSIVDFSICLGISFALMVMASLARDGVDKLWLWYLTRRILRGARRGRRKP